MIYCALLHKVTHNISEVTQLRHHVTTAPVTRISYHVQSLRHFIHIITNSFISFSSQSYNYTFSLLFLFHIFTFIFFIFSRIISLHIFSQNLLIPYKFHKSILKSFNYILTNLYYLPFGSSQSITIYYTFPYFFFLFTFFLYHKSSFSLITFHKLYYDSIWLIVTHHYSLLFNIHISLFSISSLNLLLCISFFGIILKSLYIFLFSKRFFFFFFFTYYSILSLFFS